MTIEPRARDDRPLRSRLEWYANTMHQPPDGMGQPGAQGYKNLLHEALAELRRLDALALPVTCLHCKKEIDRADDWFRCTDCRGHYHEGCIKAHAKDWRPSHD